MQWTKWAIPLLEEKYCISYKKQLPVPLKEFPEHPFPNNMQFLSFLSFIQNTGKPSTDQNLANPYSF